MRALTVAGLTGIFRRVTSSVPDEIGLWLNPLLYMPFLLFNRRSVNRDCLEKNLLHESVQVSLTTISA